MFEVGQKVKIVGAEIAVECNGKIGKIISISDDLCTIKLSDGTEVRFRDYKLEEVKEVLTKDNLETGHIVKLREGRYLMVIRDAFDGNKFIDFKDGFCYLNFDKYRKDLIYNGDHRYDIVEVLEAKELTDAFRAISNNAFDKLKLIYERKSPREEQLETLITKLKGQLTNAEKELADIKEVC